LEDAVNFLVGCLYTNRVCLDDACLVGYFLMSVKCCSGTVVRQFLHLFLFRFENLWFHGPASSPARNAGMFIYSTITSSLICPGSYAFPDDYIRFTADRTCSTTCLHLSPERSAGGSSNRQVLLRSMLPIGGRRAHDIAIFLKELLF